MPARPATFPADAADDIAIRMSKTSMEHAARVAVIADVHGNVPALAAVLDEIAEASIEVIVSCGDLTWGPLPRETLELVDRCSIPLRFVRGNAERALADVAANVERGDGDRATPREKWMVRQHPEEDIARLGSWPEQLTIDIDGLGRVRFCHGSSRSDNEAVTPATPEERMHEIVAALDGEQVLVTAHTHLQFDRGVCGIRSVNAGSVGMPYQGELGAFWAVLGPDVELRRTAYDVQETARRYRETTDPLAETMVEMLLKPATPDEIIEHAERVVFSD